MKTTFKIALFALVLAISFSCRKKLASADADLVGTWTNDEDTEIQVNANGKGYSHYDDGFERKNIDGKVTVENEVITVKAFGVKETYKIDKRPYEKSGLTVIELNGDKFIKK